MFNLVRLILFTFCWHLLHTATPAQDQSVLSSGSWYKIGITEDGIYKLDNTLFAQLGIDNEIIPDHVSLYGNGTGMLPQNNDQERSSDIEENAIAFFGDSDDEFESDEYFLFYGKGPHQASFDGFDWIYTSNSYSDTSYYFLKIGTEQGLRITTKENFTPGNQTITSDNHLVVYDPETTNLLNYVNSGGSGREWYGDLLIPSTGLVKSYDFVTPNLIDSIKIVLDVIGFSESQTSMDVSLNQSPIGSLQINSSTVSTYSQKGRPSKRTFETLSSGETQNIILDFIRTDGSIYGFINQILVTYRRNLVYEGEPLFYNNQCVPDQNAVLGLSSQRDLTIWEVTNKTNPSALSHAYNNDLITHASSSDSLRFFVAFESTEVGQKPIAFGPVSNQNIRALRPKDGLIISAPEFLTQARTLADHHKQHDDLDVQVITTRQIYNEFASGMQDVSALRDAVRHFYLKSTDFRYLLLFGDCSFDYKNRIKSNTNFVPVYESYNSWDPVLSYSSDDFFGFMEDSEGEWGESKSGDHSLEIGIGRLPVKSLEEADNIVKKIINYSTQNAKRGQWKNSMTYVVDDGNAGLSDTWTHMQDAEDFIDLLWKNHPQVAPEKLYIDAFPQEQDGNVESSQTVRELLSEKIEEGTFMVNFIGHGSEQRWTEETVLDIPFINELSNAERLPIFVTATCEFGRYDDPTLIAQNGESGAEKLILKQEGGAIALITTTRPVYAFTNYDVNRAFHFFLLRPLDDGPEMGQLPRLGDIIRNTKNNSLNGPINRNFALLGDPMLRLDYPDLPIKTISINDTPVDLQKDTLKALQEIIIEGNIQDFNNQLFEEFNGVVEVKVYDTFSETLTLGQRDAPFPYKVRENLLFKGSASVTNGKFEVQFVMPKNISYQFEEGSITYYAYDPILEIDAAGGFNQFLIGGSSDASGIDNTPPEISLTIDRPGFVSGRSVTRSDTLLAQIFDESGINTSGLGLNRDITLTVNDTTYEINELYQASLDSYQNGEIRFPLSSFDPGNYTAQLNLFDLHNNPANATVEFKVTNQPELPLTDVILYPNPAVDRFSVQLSHERANETLDIRMDLLAVDGKCIMTKEWVRTDFDGFTQPFSVDLDARTIQNGIYLCNLQVKSRLDGAIATVSRRLIIIN